MSEYSVSKHSVEHSVDMYVAVGCSAVEMAVVVIGRKVVDLFCMNLIGSHMADLPCAAVM